MGKILSISLRKSQGAARSYVDEAELIADFGIKGDMGGGDLYRQVSFSPPEAAPFANFCVSGIDFGSLRVGTHLKSGAVVFRLSQIGIEAIPDTKEAPPHKSSPTQIVFAEVFDCGDISTGDSIEVLTD